MFVNILFYQNIGSNYGIMESVPDTIVTPWKVEGKLNNETYAKLIKDFGVEALTSELLERFKKVTKHELHPLMRRGMCFAHRGLENILDDVEQGKQIFLYTGRGPTSDALHLGHIIPIEFTAWLQKVLNAIVVIQMADDEKYWFKDMEFDTIYKLGFLNARDIIALGFDPNKTLIFSNRDFTGVPSYQKVVFDIMKHVNINTIQHIFGIDSSACAGQLVWPVYQSAAAFSQAFAGIFGNTSVRCLVTYAIDQDPYFRMARDVAPKLGFEKPCALMCQFLPALEGNSKMSSTGNTGPVKTIFMNDTEEDVKDKINKYAFSGGQDTVELHRKLGGNPDIDIAFQWLRYFLDDDDELVKIANAYKSGKMLSGELKKITINVVNDIIRKHNEAKAKVTPEIVERFYDYSKFKV